ncbi:MAG: 6,7-dimethyl-8-ribityllumazine synthase, partial [Pseudomonadota bacterium]
MASTEEHATLPLPSFSTPQPKLLIVAAPFYRRIADDLIAGARAVIDAAGATADRVEVPGALEVPTVIGLARR